MISMYCAILMVQGARLKQLFFSNQNVSVSYRLTVGKCTGAKLIPSHL